MTFLLFKYIIYTFAARICSIHFQASCYQSSWQTPLLGFSPKTRRRLRLGDSNGILEYINSSFYTSHE